MRYLDDLLGEVAKIAVCIAIVANINLIVINNIMEEKNKKECKEECIHGCQNKNCKAKCLPGLEQLDNSDSVTHKIIK